uniref:Uncharacterized protein n=1 Tax=Astyanax mexicanus TaxID=7994 RepID=A0A8B9K2C7_ASTMX
LKKEALCLESGEKTVIQHKNLIQSMKHYDSSSIWAYFAESGQEIISIIDGTMTFDLYYQITRVLQDNESNCLPLTDM